jgi:hypothetical protein
MCSAHYRRHFILHMSHPDKKGIGSRALHFIMEPFRSVLFWWRHGPITPAAAERIDRIRNPKKYLAEVNAPEKL